jgi:DNA-binding NarL/FixJ family response regulator
MFPPEVAKALQQAADDLARYRGDRFEQFDRVRSTMTELTTVDAFYVAEFVGNDAVHYHHQYDGNTFDLPGSMPVVRGRTAHWVRTHRRTYRYAEDNGAALHAGTSFGQTDKTSRDALVTPVFDDLDDRVVTGLISVQAYVPDVYDTVAVGALEYLADALGAQIAHEERAAERSKRLGAEPFTMISVQTAEDLLDTVIVSLGALHDRFDEAMTRTVDTDTDTDTDTTLRTLRRELERLQSELWAHELHHQRLVADRLASLTPRQRTLAGLLAELSSDSDNSLSTAELATRMAVTEATVKSHMNAVLRAFGASDRAEVRRAIRRLTIFRLHNRA